MGVLRPFLTSLLLRLNVVPPPLFDAYADGMKLRVIQAAVHFNLFDMLEGSWLSAGEISHNLSLDPRGLELLLKALAAARYLRFSNGKYTNSRIASKWLSTRSAYSLGHMVRFGQGVLERWKNLEGALAAGKPILQMYDYLAEHKEAWSHYVHGMKEMATFLSWFVVRRVSLPKTAEKLLDLGGSHGTYSAGFCKKYPRLRATVLDYPGAVPYGQEIIREMGMQDRIDFREGDFLKDPLGEDYDVVLLFNVLHTFSAETNMSILQKVMGSMRKGGLVVIGDAFSRRGETPNEVATLGALTMYIETGGETYPIEKVQEWLKECGFTQLKKASLPLPGGYLLSGKKP